MYYNGDYSYIAVNLFGWEEKKVWARSLSYCEALVK